MHFWGSPLSGRTARPSGDGVGNALRKRADGVCGITARAPVAVLKAMSSFDGGRAQGERGTDEISVETRCPLGRPRYPPPPQYSA